jgi:tetratricopeptide (TPR) repeat protein
MNMLRWTTWGNSKERIKNSGNEDLTGGAESPETKLQSKIRIIKNLIVAEDPHILLKQIADSQIEDLYKYRHKANRPEIKPLPDLARTKIVDPAIPKQGLEDYEERAESPKERLDTEPPASVNQSKLPTTGLVTTFTNPIIPTQRETGFWTTNIEQNPLQAPQPSGDPVMPRFIAIHRESSLRHLKRKALIQFEEGYYDKARDDLESLREKANGVPKLYQEITYHLSIVLMRQGDYHKVYELVKILQKEARFQEIEGDLRSSRLPPSLLDDPEVEIVLGTTRILGLLQGYYGHYEKAEGILRNAATDCDNFNRARQDFRSQASSVIKPTPANQGDAETSTNKDAQRKPRRPWIDTSTVKAKIDLASAKLFMLEGQEGKALNILRPTLRSVERQFGIRHMLAFEAASLNALVLARNFDKEAEIVCTTTINAMSRYLIREHPLTMEALSTLVSIFISQARLSEALDTMQALLKQAIKKLGKSHPQTLRYRCQLGDIYIDIGNYLQAKEAYILVYQTATEKWKDQQLDECAYPDVFRYLTKLAHANYYTGNLFMAQQQIKDALSKQARIFREKSTNATKDINPIFEKNGFGLSTRPWVHNCPSP